MGAMGFAMPTTTSENLKSNSNSEYRKRSNQYLHLPKNVNTMFGGGLTAQKDRTGISAWTLDLDPPVISVNF